MAHRVRERDRARQALNFVRTFGVSGRAGQRAFPHPRQLPPAAQYRRAGPAAAAAAQRAAAAAAADAASAQHVHVPAVSPPLTVQPVGCRAAAAVAAPGP